MRSRTGAFSARLRARQFVTLDNSVVRKLKPDGRVSSCKDGCSYRKFVTGTRCPCTPFVYQSAFLKSARPEDECSEKRPPISATQKINGVCRAFVWSKNDRATGAGFAKRMHCSILQFMQIWSFFSISELLERDWKNEIY
jgi:hypothetical protein